MGPCGVIIRAIRAVRGCADFRIHISSRGVHLNTAVRASRYPREGKLGLKICEICGYSLFGNWGCFAESRRYHRLDVCVTFLPWRPLREQVRASLTIDSVG
jgi:hypothetical protein